LFDLTNDDFPHPTTGMMDDIEIPPKVSSTYDDKPHPTTGMMDNTETPMMENYCQLSMTLEAIIQKQTLHRKSRKVNGFNLRRHIPPNSRYDG
jgi:hypothetical protein